MGFGLWEKIHLPLELAWAADNVQRKQMGRREKRSVAAPGIELNWFAEEWDTFFTLIPRCRILHTKRDSQNVVDFAESIASAAVKRDISQNVIN